MTTARILDGAEIAKAIKAEVAADVAALAAQGIRPGLAAVLVGNVPASQIYVRSKVKTCAELGLFSELITPPETVTTEEMLALVASLNAREDIDGILIQLPLPPQVNAKLLLEAVSPAKDVDGFHPVNVGKVQSGQPALAPCTPAGNDPDPQAQRPADRRPERRHYRPQRHRRQARRDAAAAGKRDVTICHSKTHNLAAHCRGADILVAAIGRPGFVTPDMVKPGATILDVGINRINDREEFDKFFLGDVRREETVSAQGIDDCWRRASRGLRGQRRIHPGPRRRRSTHDRNAHGEHRPRRATAPRIGLASCCGSALPAVWAAASPRSVRCLPNWGSRHRRRRSRPQLMQPGEAVYNRIVDSFGARGRPARRQPRPPRPRRTCLQRRPNCGTQPHRASGDHRRTGGVDAHESSRPTRMPSQSSNPP
jgi:methylenetetrahydrofolate dehydrogenase (NADP+)/methenyltetrahydrofolate cyclohydrolase